MSYRNRSDNPETFVGSVSRQILTGNADTTSAAPRLVSDDATFTEN